MKVIGLFFVLALSVGLGFLYMESVNWDSQSLPVSYQVMDDLENKGIYSGEDIHLQTIDLKNINLSAFQGKIVILSFWATWCEPCVEEFPSFLKLLDAFPDKVTLIAISHDYEEEDVRGFVSAFQGYRKNLILTMDKNKSLSKAFGVDRLPEGFIFNGEGKLVKKIIGIQDWATPNALDYFKAL